MQKSLTIVEMQKEISTQITNNKEALSALAVNTFKGVDASCIPQAVLEGMMRGYSIQDFMTKKIYAIPFYNSSTKKMGYALVTSISDARAIAMKSGQSGKSAPTFTMTPDGHNIESCSVTVWRKDGDERGYTATVYLDEYQKPAKEYNGKKIPGMWQTKPRTMIAKVAEMHALRMAFPEQIGDQYIEEEFEKSSDEKVIDATDVPLDEKAIETAIEVLKKATTVDELKEAFKALSLDLRKDAKVIQAYKDHSVFIKKALASEKK